MKFFNIPFHAAFYGASNGELAIVGDGDPKESRALVEELLGGWASPGAYARISGSHRATPARSVVIATPDKANAAVLCGLNLALRDTDPEFPALLLANEVLGGSTHSRLFTRVREQEGLSYGIGSSLWADHQGTLGRWDLSAICAPRNADRVEAACREELAKALDTGFTDQELADAKAGWLQSQRLGLAEDAALAGCLAGQAEAGRTMAFQSELEAQVAALTGEQVLAAIRKHLVTGNLSWVKAGDFGG